MPGDPQALVVPVEVSALAVTDQMVAHTPFRRWEPKFYRRAPRVSPEPDPLRSFTGLTKPSDQGVYLHWELPAALTRGRVDLTGPRPQDIVFPLIPNRWLVVRHFRKDADPTAPPVTAGWVVESDNLTNGTSHFLHNGTSTKIGRRHDLSTAPWQEPTTAPPPFLRADGPGLTDFTTFQPYNTNVVSLHDELPGDLMTTPGVLSYLVVGWHSTPEADPLSPDRIKELLAFRGEDTAHTTDQDRFTAALKGLNWHVAGLKPGESPRPAHRSLYLGTVLTLRWKPGDTPESDKPPNALKEIDVAVGQNTADARTALIAQNTPPRDRLLIEAFEYGVLDELDDAIGDGGRDVMDDASHRTWFQPSPAGRTWQIVDRPTPEPHKGLPARRLRTRAEQEAERAWLERLNEDQHAYDEACRTLDALRGQLYELWWASGLPERPTAPADFDTPCAQQLDPARQDPFDSTKASLAARVKKQMTLCFGDGGPEHGTGGLRSKVPHGRDPAAFAASITAYATAHHLAADRELKCVPHPVRHRPTDPVVILRGPGTTVPLPRTASLPCRTPDRLLAELGTHGRPLRPPTPGTKPAYFPQLAAALPWASLGDVFTEFLVLQEIAALVRAGGGAAPRDPLGKAAQDKGITAADGTGRTALWPEFSQPWRQPWAPLYLLWEAECYPLPFVTPGSGNPTAHWTFDGRQHRWNGTGAQPYQMISGKARLTPLPAFALRGRIKEYQERYGSDHLEQLLKQIHSPSTAQQISQTLDGVNAWLAQRVPATHFDTPGVPGSAPDAPDPVLGTRTSHFAPVRAGQLVLTQLLLVDRFGQTVPVINAGNRDNRRPMLSVSVTPDSLPDPCDHTKTKLLTAASDRAGYRFIQLRPRLQQPARTCFEPLSARDDNRPVDTDALPVTPGNSPVCGWLVLDRRDHSLMVHGSDGAALGELHAAGPPGKEKTDWLPLPGSPWKDRAAVVAPGFTTAHPHLGSFVKAVLDAPGTAAFHDLRAAVDLGLRTVVPPPQHSSAQWSLLAGRPLALIRARIRIELSGPPVNNPTWHGLIKGPGPGDGNALRTTRWPIRLGDPNRAGDGLIGYYAADPTGNPQATRYDRLYTAHRPDRTESTLLHPVDASADPAVVAAPRPDLTTAPVPGAPPTPPAQGTAAWVTLLADPWAAVHAHTGILPVTTLRLPEPYLYGPLHQLALHLRTGPLLTRIETVPDVPGNDNRPPGPVVALPRPSAWTGTWAWAEHTPPTAPKPWLRLPLGGLSTAVRPPDATPEAHTGYLVLSPPSEGTP
ncbi:hypothetical protein ACSNOH_01505 [Streptomyces sp. URMC 127]|uniref:hypothetical protein n=1 Tax=Streptomyces sp. URMC 127 TaxID=3423402 RepID=UPI003F1C8E38